MKISDSLYLALIAIGLLYGHFVQWPAFLRRSEVDPGRARVRLCFGTMIQLWMLVAAGATLWLLEARAWGAIRLVLPHGWALWGSTGLVLAVALNYGRTILKLARRDRSKRIKLGNPVADKYLPHTRYELGWWLAVSLSVGFCEEFLFRGYLIFAFQPLLGLWGAAAVSVVVFALGHAYQGIRSTLGPGIVGSLLTLVVLVSGSLLPAMALHALVDIGDGVVAWLVFRDVRPEGDMVSAPGTSA